MEGGRGPATFVNSGKLEGAIPASDITKEGTAQIAVSNPAPGGGISTNLNLQTKKE